MSLIEFEVQGGTVRLVWCLEQPPRAVWRHLVDVERLPEWLGSATHGGFEKGQTLVVNHGEGYLCRSEVLEIEPPDALDMTWRFPDEPPSRLRLRLASEPHGAPVSEQPQSTYVRLHHFDLGELAGEYLAGWITHMTFFEASLDGKPLPWTAFWPICGTNAQLTRS